MIVIHLNQKHFIILFYDYDSIQPKKPLMNCGY